MIPTQHKEIAGKKRCDRCQRANGPVCECSFEFKHPRAYWKGLYEAQTGKRLTLKRRKALDESQFDYRQPPSYWMGLCADCWAECSRPRDMFPMEFWQDVLSADAAKRLTAPNFVPENGAPGASARNLVLAYPEGV